MKPFYLLLLTIATLFSCKEKLPIGYVIQNAQGDESYYNTSPIPAQQDKKILVEEFTGVICANCPQGAALLKTIQKNNPNKILVAKLYSYLFNGTKVLPDDYVFKNDQAEEIAVFLKEELKPSASIDRLYTNNGYSIKTGDWISTISTQLAKTTPINIDITSASYNQVNKKVDLEIDFVATESINEKLNYSIYVLEDNIIAGQDSIVGSTTVVIPNYNHSEVMQQCVTPTGIGIPFSNKFTTSIAGSAMRKKLSFDLATRILNPTNCKVLVFVHRNEGTNREVLHVEEKHLD